jgi:ADP-heptose:LPS heptosyltransferase
MIAATSREAENLKTVMDNCDGQNVISLAGKTTLAEAAALISGASLVVAMNSASLHIADAFQRPMVILYSGTEYLTEWEPRQSPAIILNRDVSCAPCRKFWCPYNKECLDFTPEEVLRAAVQLLSTKELDIAKQVKL